MRWLYLVVSILVLCSIQFVLMSHAQYAPDLLVIFAVFLALNAPREMALTGAWLCGLFSEVSSGQAGHLRIGAIALVLTFFAWVLTRHRTELFIGHWLTRTIIVALVSAVCGLATIAVVYLETRHFVNWTCLHQMLIGVALTTGLSIPLCPLFSRIRRLYSNGRH